MQTSTGPNWLAATIAALTLAGCASGPAMPITTEDYVDLDRFMGDWYVIATIPTRFERDAHNAVETYARGDGNRIETTFTFLKGGFDGERKTYTPTGFVREGTGNAEWGMQFIWPFKAEYLVLYVDDDYRHTIIGRSKRDYVWIMARRPVIAEADFERMRAFIEAEGYDLDKLVTVPQRWPEPIMGPGGAH
ncbi:MAG: lipocalin family protein [Pseudomonadota bacterium]